MRKLGDTKGILFPAKIFADNSFMPVILQKNLNTNYSKL